MEDTNKEDRVHINVSLSQEEKQRLKIYAIKKGKTVSSIIQEFIASLDIGEANDD